MTEKRFVNIAKEPIFIVVNDTFENEVLTDDDVVDCLNALHEENQNLKETLWEAEVNYIEERNEYSIDIEKDLEYLKKEWDREYWNDDSDWEYWKK